MEIKSIRYKYKGYDFIVSKKVSSFNIEEYGKENGITYRSHYEIHMYAEDKQGKDLTIGALVEIGNLVKLHKMLMNKMVKSMEDFIEDTALSLE